MKKPSVSYLPHKKCLTCKEEIALNEEVCAKHNPMNKIEEWEKEFDSKFPTLMVNDSTSLRTFYQYGDIKEFITRILSQALAQREKERIEELKEIQTVVTDPDVNGRKAVVKYIDELLSHLQETERK